MLGITLIAAASLAGAKPAKLVTPSDFDLAAVNSAQQRAAQRKFLTPRISDLPEQERNGMRFRFKGNKVKLYVPI